MYTLLVKKLEEHVAAREAALLAGDLREWQRQWALVFAVEAILRERSQATRRLVFSKAVLPTRR